MNQIRRMLPVSLFAAALLISGASHAMEQNQRQKAVNILSHYKDKQGTVGHTMFQAVDSVHQTLCNVGLSEFQSGKIGDHYEDLRNQGVFDKPATKENFDKVAEQETQFWKTPQGSALGAIVPASTRAACLVRTATKNGDLKKK
jgi:hypothetical protein